MRAAIWAGLLILLGARGAIGQGNQEFDLLDSQRFDDADYLTPWSCGLTFDQSGSGPTIHATSTAQYGGFARRTEVPANWSDYDVASFVIKNHENHSLSMRWRIEATTDSRDMSRVVQVAFTIPANAQVQYAFELRTDRARAVGMRGLPSVFNTTHRRLYAHTTLDMTRLHGWRLSVNESGTQRFTVSRMKLTKRAPAFNSIVDMFGQYSFADWPNKVDAPSDFVAQNSAELSDLAAYPGAGGYEGTTLWPGQQKSNRWRTVRLASGKWYFVHPSGKLFWSFGLLGVRAWRPTNVTGRESFFASLPPNSGDTAAFWGTGLDGSQTFDFGSYNQSRKFGSGWQTAFNTRAMTRLKSWGFNTIGPGSDPALYAAGVMPYTIKVNTNDFPTRLVTPFAPWHQLPDPFHPGFQSFATTKFTAELAPHNGRKAFMGAYVDAEPSWGQMDTPMTRFQIAVAALNAAYSQPSKQALLAQLLAKYGSIQNFNAAWGTAYSSWTSIYAANCFSRDTLTSQCQEDMRLFVIDFARTYYSRVRAALTGAGLTGLYLGSREQWPTPEVTSACMPYVDTYSVTLYQEADKVDWSFPESTKPVLVAEFSYGSTDRGSFHPGPIGADDQADRGSKTRSYLLAAMRASKVIGATWFEYYDQPTIGRAQDGENYNIGFLTVTDTPYVEMRQASRALGYSLYTLRGR